MLATPITVIVVVIIENVIIIYNENDVSIVEEVIIIDVDEIEILIFFNVAKDASGDEEFIGETWTTQLVERCGSLV